MVMGEGEAERGRARTLGEHSDCFTEIARLAVYPLGVFEHSSDKPEFAEQAMLPGAIQSDVRLGQMANGIDVVHRLDHGIRVRVQDVRLQPAVRCFVVKATLRVSIALL
jgi:hypothetical protein